MKNLENKWTYADLNGGGWINPTFDSKEEAISEARMRFEDNGFIVVGQLRKSINSYHPVNQAYVKYK